MHCILLLAVLDLFTNSKSELFLKAVIQSGTFKAPTVLHNIHTKSGGILIPANNFC